jgi:hypothetical protein
MALQSSKQAAKRMGDRLERAEDRLSDEQLATRLERLYAAHERTQQREQALAAIAEKQAASTDGPQPLGVAKPSIAPEITAEKVNSMSWNEIADYSNNIGDDPEAWEKLAVLVEEREAREKVEYAGYFDAPEDFKHDTNELTNPSIRPARKITDHERVREEYEHYTAAQYFQAENEIGFMLNKEGQANGIDAYSLFSGPASRVEKYGSEELQSWFQRNGRQTLSAFRYHLTGWHSDYKAAERSKIESFDNVALV